MTLQESVVWYDMIWVCMKLDDCDLLRHAPVLGKQNADGRTYSETRARGTRREVKTEYRCELLSVGIRPPGLQRGRVAKKTIDMVIRVIGPGLREAGREVGRAVLYDKSGP